MIHFVFTLVKITIQAAVYAGLLFALFRIIAAKRPGTWWDRVSGPGARFYPTAWVPIWIGLFFFLFSYWGFHGFGDGPRVPIGHGLFVDNTNWTEYGYIQEIKTSDGHELEMTRFLPLEGYLLGNLDSWFDSYSHAFFIYDLEQQALMEFVTEADFNAYASTHGFPPASELRTFAENYQNRWGGWWFWLLP